MNHLRENEVDYFFNSHCLLKPTDSKFDVNTITVEEVLSELKNLEGNKSSGPDNISPKFLKDSCHIIAPILTIIFNQSLKTEIFPDDWAPARVSPIFKSGVKAEIGNYLIIGN